MEWFKALDVPASVLRWLLGDIDQSGLTKYSIEGLVTPSKRGYYRLETVHNIIKRLRKQAAGHVGRTDDVDAVKSAAALKDAQRELAEVRTAKLKGELVSAPEVADAWREVALAVKQLFLSFPARARFDCPTLTPHDQKALENLARDMLHECATEGNVRLPAPPK